MQSKSLMEEAIWDIDQLKELCTQSLHHTMGSYLQLSLPAQFHGDSWAHSKLFTWSSVFAMSEPLGTPISDVKIQFMTGFSFHGGKGDQSRQ